MARLTPEGALGVWEAGNQASLTRRALALLAAAEPQAEPRELAALPLGERDRRLLELRAVTLGSRLAACSRCPACGEELEMDLAVADLLQLPPTASGDQRLEIGSLGLRFRLPASADLLEAELVDDGLRAEEILLERCLLSCQRGGEPVPAAELSAAERQAVAEAMVAADPLAEVVLDLACAACGESWQELLEVADFVHLEACALARRLLGEVSLLARGYGWREAEILALSPERRQAYLELLGE